MQGHERNWHGLIMNISGPLCLFLLVMILLIQIYPGILIDWYIMPLYVGYFVPERVDTSLVCSSCFVCSQRQDCALKIKSGLSRRLSLRSVQNVMIVLCQQPNYLTITAEVVYD